MGATVIDFYPGRLSSRWQLEAVYMHIEKNKSTPSPPIVCPVIIVDVQQLEHDYIELANTIENEFGSPLPASSTNARCFSPPFTLTDVAERTTLAISYDPTLFEQVKR